MATNVLIARRTLSNTVGLRLADRVTNATGYVGQIGKLNGLPGVTDTPDSPPVKSTTKQLPDLRVRPYFVFFPGVGAPGDEDDLADTVTNLDWDFSVTAVAGDIDDLLELVDRIDAALHHWSPGLLGDPERPVMAGPIQYPVGYTPPVLLDRTVTPYRHFSPLQYVLTAHT